MKTFFTLTLLALGLMPAACREQQPVELAGAAFKPAFRWQGSPVDAVVNLDHDRWATASHDGLVRVYRGFTPELAVQTGFKATVLAWHPPGRLAVFSHIEKKAALISLPDGHVEELRLDFTVARAQYFNDHLFLQVFAKNRVVEGSIKQGRFVEERSFRHYLTVRDFVLLKERGMLITASIDRRIRFWDLDTGRERYRLYARKDVHMLAAADGVIAYLDQKKVVYTHRIISRSQLATKTSPDSLVTYGDYRFTRDAHAEGHIRGGLSAMAFHNGYLIGAGYSGGVYIHRMGLEKAEKTVWAPDLNLPAGVAALAFQSDRVIAAMYNGSLARLNAQSLEIEAILVQNMAVESAIYPLNDGRFPLLVLFKDGYYSRFLGDNPAIEKEDYYNPALFRRVDQKSWQPLPKGDTSL